MRRCARPPAAIAASSGLTEGHEILKDATVELDTRGLNCPLPVLKAQKAIRGMPTGARLRVLATDPKAPADFAQLCETAGHVLIESSELHDHYLVVIEKRG
jgi:tRNA 2-thiouridine synthesizing protein A